MPNRLAGETSPYLLQHKDNPVDWYSWGPEAMAAAALLDKPILLSVGYSACHWCHVMERESFEDAQIAALMNQLFVNIKVDREERPDVDSVYMAAVQAMTGHGGWPMTVFLTPDGRPFYGGTYFPPEDRGGLPSFPRVLQSVAHAFSTRRGDILGNSSRVIGAIQAQSAPRRGEGPLDHELLDHASLVVISDADRRNGGFGLQPKFPQPMVHEFLLRYWKQTNSADGLGVVKTTLEKMARGGIFDQIGGGFHRYSTDSVWLAPHFEKMLYDNASVGGAVPPRLASDGRTAVPAGRRKDAGLRAEGDDPSSRRLLFGAGRRLRRRRGQVLRLVAAGDRTSVGAGTRPRRQGVLGCEP